MKNTCPECGKVFTGRSDKRFCCDMCRNNWHNRNYREERNYMSIVNGRLAANRRILENIYDTGKRKVPRALLEEEKFDFSHFTSFKKTPLGKKTYSCYEFSYSSDLHQNITIHKD